MSAATNEALVRRAIEAIRNRGDFGVADGLAAAAYVHTDGLIADLVVGPEATEISTAWHLLAFLDLRVTIEDCNASWSTGRPGQSRPVGPSAVRRRQTGCR